MSNRTAPMYINPAKNVAAFLHALMMSVALLITPAMPIWAEDDPWNEEYATQGNDSAGKEVTDEIGKTGQGWLQLFIRVIAPGIMILGGLAGAYFFFNGQMKALGFTAGGITIIFIVRKFAQSMMEGN